MIGASRGTGAEVVRQAAAAGHDVIAVSRSGAGATGPGVTVAAADALDIEEVRGVVDGADAVVVTVGGSSGDRSRPRAAVTENVVTAMQEAGIRRLIVHSTYGAGGSATHAPLPVQLLIRTVLARALADHDAQEEVVRASGLDWTIVRPVGLTDAPASGVYLAVPSDDRTPLGSRIARADVAEYIVGALGDPGTIRQALTLAPRRT